MEFAGVNDSIIIVIGISTSPRVYITEAPKPAEVEDDQSHIPN